MFTKNNTIDIQIPIKPLSVNQAWQGHRLKTKKYTKFEEDVYILLPKNTNQIKGYLEISYKFYLKNWKRIDGDNCVKCLQDILVKSGLISDDRKIMKYTIEKIPSNEDSIKIEISEYKP